jgi:4-hydroxy-4-methyl-2-oxoglutarate aldolase
VTTDAELARVRGRLFGLIAEENINAVDIPRPDPQVVERLLGLTDLCSTISDVLDILGVGAAISGSDLAPRGQSARICGPAITIRYGPEGGTAGALTARGQSARLADRDLYAVGESGDVAVFDCGGDASASVMGGLSARWARRLGMAGCVIDGAMRDLESVERDGVPVWSRGVTPRSGKRRMQAIEINGVVAIAGATVRPGDVIAADSSGVCVIPADVFEDVVARCLEADAAEVELIEAIKRGGSIGEVTALLPPEKW